MKSKAKTGGASITGTQLPAGNYTPHLLAQFVPGEMTNEEFEALRTSVKEDGVRIPVVIYEGQLLDGRHRYKAAKEQGIAVPYIEFKGTKDQAIALVMDNNLHRRQLNAMQKGLVAARMCLVKVNPPTQKDAAAKVGVGLQIVNLAVRLLNSNNTPLIKRAEAGDASRSEIDELLYDRASHVADKVDPVTITAGAGDDDDLLGDDKKVVPLRPSVPSKASKVPHPERHARSTPASLAVQHFKALDDKARANFCSMAWQWLRPALLAAGKISKEEGAPIPTKDKPITVPTAGKRAFKKAVRATAPAAAPAKKAA